QGELQPLVAAVPERVAAALNAWQWRDLLSLAQAIGTVVGAFAGIAAGFATWGLRQVLGLLRILVDVVAPKLMPYISKARSTFGIIVRDPIGFVRNLVAAARLGFELFARNILIHLRTALISWLLGPLAAADVYLPTSFSLVEILKLLLSILGLTWKNIRGKLLRVIPEPVLAGLERTAAVLVTLVQAGPAAAWEQIQDQLPQLKDRLITSILDMVATQVVQAAVTRLVTMLNPAGAVVQAILAIWRTISFFLDKFRQIGAVVGTFIDSITAIATGRITGAAKSVEQTMARTLPLVISFLANFAGLGGIPKKLVAIVERLRAPVDRALDKIVDWLERTLKKITDKAKSAARGILQWWRKRIPLRVAGEQHTLEFEGGPKDARLVVHSKTEKPHQFLKRLLGKKKEWGEGAAQAIKDVENLQVELSRHQKKLEKADSDDKEEANGKNEKAKSGTDPKGADKLTRKGLNDLASQVDGLFGKIAETIVEALSGVKPGATVVMKFTEAIPGLGDVIIEKFKIDRGDFRVTQKRDIADEVKGKDGFGGEHVGNEAKKKEKPEKDQREYVAEGIARRHIVSSYDMRTHYVKFLDGKTLVHAKTLLERRGSIAASHTPLIKKGRVKEFDSGKKEYRKSKSKELGLTRGAVWATAEARYKNFFGYVKNIFLGDSSENSSIGERLDDRLEGLDADGVDDHVARVKRGWALDQSMHITPPKEG
ncbi:MAG: hypothetical protein L0H39_07245, partial [Brachybacterium sp.]|nr:hypothetical protein [Brachybacterium sp.]